MKYTKEQPQRISSKNRKGAKSFFAAILVLLFILASVFLIYDYKKNYIGTPSISSVYKDWENKAYDNVYKKTELILAKRPYDGEVLAMRGFASYYIFAEQTDFSLSYAYLNDCILHLRQAMYNVKKNHIPKIAYMLGKAYYQKGYYYADIALKYLDIAYTSNEKFKDLAEFRGMTASVLGLYEDAVESFSEALSEQASDVLLFALAESYVKINDIQNAKLYLNETIEKTKDTILEIKCRYMLGILFLEEEQTETALKEFKIILEKDTNYADARYGLGLVYEKRGDLIKARSEWRKALKLDPLHIKVREKLKL